MMRAATLVYLYLTATSSFVAPEQAMRTEALTPTQTTHMVDVIGWLGVMTTVQLPDSFEAKNVRCGACVDVAAEGDASTHPQGGQDHRNWAIEVSPQERNIHLRPREMPTADNPVAAFSTNVFITLDGGHSINLQLRLWDPRVDGPQGHKHADAVVSLTLPGTESLSGRLSQQRAQLADAHRQDVVTAGHRWLLERLSGTVRCQSPRWPRPKRLDKTVIRLQQLCQAEGTQRMAWAVVQIENDGDTALDVQNMALEPQEAVPGTAAYWVDKPHLAFAAKAVGIASYTVADNAPFASRWRLRITPASQERAPLVLEHLVFE